MRKCTAVFILLMILTSVLTSCGAQSAKAADNGYRMETTASSAFDYFSFDGESPMLEDAAEAEVYYDSDFSSGSVTGGSAVKTQSSSVTSTAQQNITDTRKIIKTVNLTLETKTFDQAVTDIAAGAEKLGGYIENSHVSGRGIDNVDSARYASFTLRIPSAVLDEYVGYIEGSYHVTSHNTNAQDITDSYYDTESRLKSLITQEERLLEMLEGATELEYMLRIEDKLANVRYQIESYHSTLSRYDKQVALSTVHISLNEVVEYQKIETLPKSFGERMSIAMKNSWENFVDNLEDFAIDFVYSLPGIICFVIFVLITVLVIVLIVRRYKKKAAQRRKALEEQNVQLEKLRQSEMNNK